MISLRATLAGMTSITDEQMRALLPTSQPYTAVILRAGPNRRAEGADAIVWEHGRRNFELRADGLLSIVCPVTDDSEVRGIGIFALDPDETRAVMEEDPAVKAGVLTYELHPCRSFPGDALPAR
jgi:hypothetical protein